MRIDKKKILNIVANVLSALIFLSGWILYIGSSIARDEEEARKINEQTKSIMDSLPVIKETIVRTTDENSERYIDYINKLIEENDSMRDSLIYYSMYYDITSKQIDADYVFEKKKTKDGYDYIGYLRKRVSIKTVESFIDTSNLVNTDTVLNE